MNVIECRDLSKIYRGYHAVQNMSFQIKENTITGLIGRNGAGKTTLLKMIAGFYNITAGEVRVFDEPPFNSLKVSANMIFIDDQMVFPPSFSLLDILKASESFYENWDMELATNLMEYFSLKTWKFHQNLSKGQKSTFNMIVGLAARCPLTIFDEPTTGMDAGVRKDFYRALLKEYLRYPRTMIISSHLLNEIQDLLEDILLIDEGKVVMHMAVTDLREYAIGITGEKSRVRRAVPEKNILYREDLGVENEYVVALKQELDQLQHLGFKLSPVSPDEVCVYLTSKNKGGIDDVFKRG